VEQIAIFPNKKEITSAKTAPTHSYHHHKNGTEGSSFHSPSSVIPSFISFSQQDPLHL